MTNRDMKYTVLTKSVNSRVQVSVSVLSVHIVSSGSGVVFNPHAKVLHVSAVLLSDLKQQNNKRTIMRTTTNNVRNCSTFIYAQFISDSSNLPFKCP
jgi:hypothetical protein